MAPEAAAWASEMDSWLNSSSASLDADSRRWGVQEFGLAEAEGALTDFVGAWVKVMNNDRFDLD